ncbi:MAG: hypothetical protein MJ211_10450 [Bacteroidales bacterium]|nr:hypothetical protein [Bacteroidales bacterium]
MSILNSLNNPDIWNEFFIFKTNKGLLKKREFKFLSNFIENQEYLPIAKSIILNNYQFDFPTKYIINKSGSDKKRVVYRFSKSETIILKMISYLLYKYDSKICKSCYSFRRNITAKNAISDICSIKNLNEKYVLKVDIHNYFNSIPSKSLVIVLKEIIDDDNQLLNLLSDIILKNQVYQYDNENNKILITENCGAMAGVPISAFFANIYLKSLDLIFEEKGINYFRYSDDILVFADSLEEIIFYKNLIFNHISKKGLSINSDKVKISNPNEDWDFLGFCYRKGNIDLSKATLVKIKSKIKRKSHALMRSKNRKGYSFDQVASDLADHFNRKFYDEENEMNFTWSRWFFPIITTVESLHLIDQYLIEYMRYLNTGVHSKKNFNIKYSYLKELGFRSLVNEYYKSNKKRNF